MVVKTSRGYISVREFLDSLDGRLSKNTVYEAIAAGIIPSIRIARRRILVPADALDRMLEEQSGAER
jgi:excisionase family DNA binding protein